MKVIGCMAVFNEEATLGSAIQSCIGFVDKLVIVDGAWKGVDAGSPKSTDNTRSIIRSVQKIWPMKVHAIFNDEYWESQDAKREAYLVGEEEDIYFVLDGDERLFCGAEWLRLVESCYLDETAFNAVIWNKGAPCVLHPRVYRRFSYYKFPEAKRTLPIVIEHLSYWRSLYRELVRRRATVT